METISSTISGDTAHDTLDQPDNRLVLAVAWANDEPERVGEVLLPASPDQAIHRYTFGRGDSPGSSYRLRLYRQQPGRNVATEPLRDQRISRDQLGVWIVPGGALEVENIGRRPLLINGRPAEPRHRIRTGDVLELRDRLLLLAVRRPSTLPALELPDALMPAFGHADGCGMVGESPAMWRLRGQVAFAAARHAHVLVGGPSGTGKELVAQAVHALSSRATRPLIARNAATIPDTLIDAELFGNLRDYPNPGMAERAGLIGAAHRSTLFLDEIGELPHTLQAHLLRVLDRGEYQRLGESATRSADIRLIAATNRPSDQLKHDFLARLRLRLEVPGLDQRREDIGMLIPFLVRRMAAGDPQLAARFFEGGEPSGQVRLDPHLVQVLLHTRYTTHIRQVESVLWTAIMHSVTNSLSRITLNMDALERDPLVPTPSTVAVTPEDSAEDLAQVRPESLTRAEIEAALERCGGVQDRAWRLLGLSSRYQLIRLLKKHGLHASRKKS